MHTILLHTSASVGMYSNNDIMQYYNIGTRIYYCNEGSRVIVSTRHLYIFTCRAAVVVTGHCHVHPAKKLSKNRLNITLFARSSITAGFQIIVSPLDVTCLFCLTKSTWAGELPSTQTSDRYDIMIVYFCKPSDLDFLERPRHNAKVILEGVIILCCVIICIVV